MLRWNCHQIWKLEDAESTAKKNEKEGMKKGMKAKPLLLPYFHLQQEISIQSIRS